VYSIQGWQPAGMTTLLDRGKQLIRSAPPAAAAKPPAAVWGGLIM
jgi:hypothetical protein